MEPFCSVADYEARYGPVADQAMLKECLLDASDDMIAAMDAAAIDWKNPTEEQSNRFRRVCRQVAHRVMPEDHQDVSGIEPPIPSGATSSSYTMGPFNHQVSFRVPWGSTMLRNEEMRLLGISPTKAGFVSLLGGE